MQPREGLAPADGLAEQDPVAPALWSFAHIDGVEPTNNDAERALRPVGLWRKGSFGTQSDAGSRFVERIMTVAAMCKQQGRSLLDFLVATVAADRLSSRTRPPDLRC